MLRGRIAYSKGMLKKWIVYLGRHRYFLMFLVIFLSFAIPFFALYQLDAQSFNATWKGRTFYLFFLWLIILELVLDWEKFQSRKRDALRLVRTAALGVVLVLPTVYVVAANYSGLNAMIIDFSNHLYVPHSGWMPLSVEYLVFTGLFVAVVMLAYGFDGLKHFSISAVFLGAVGAVYMIDNLYPYGRFTPLQVFVPATAWLAAGVLNSMGFQTTMTSIENHPVYGSMPYLMIRDSLGRSAGFAIAWPCSGVQSLFIYTIVIVLFLKRANIRWLHSIVYFAFGALVTYFINVLRIATIFIIAAENGDWGLFHNYYGELYSMTWIIAYPSIIIGSRILWGKIKTRVMATSATQAVTRVCKEI
jgi:thaumarchaeosortase